MARTSFCGECRHFEELADDYICTRANRFTRHERWPGLRSWLGLRCGPNARFFEAADEEEKA